MAIISRIAQMVRLSMDSVQSIRGQDRTRPDGTGGIGSDDVPPSYVDFASEMLAEIPLEVVADYYPAIGELDEYAALEIVSTVPAVVVGGENDMITPIEHTARIIESLPKAEAIRVEDCGHLGMIEKHEIFNGALDGLLARARATLT